MCKRYGRTVNVQYKLTWETSARSVNIYNQYDNYNIRKKKVKIGTQATFGPMKIVDNYFKYTDIKMNIFISIK